MSQLHSLVAYLDSLLEPALYQDTCFNGLQVETGSQDVRVVAFAVDAGQSIIEQAIDAEAQLLVVHHGLFWGELRNLSGPLSRKIEMLYRHGCSLYASHLPLDGNREVGNAFELARFLQLESVDAWCDYHGATIGASGELANACSTQEIVELLSEIPGAISPTLFQFGPEQVKSIGIVTGSGTLALEALARDQLDLLLSGEPKHEAYHLAKELQVNALFAGHYATETFGVRALRERMQKDFDIQGHFIDEPSGV